MENNASDGISGAFFLSGQSFSLTSGAEDSIIAIITLEDVKMEKYAQNPPKKTGKKGLTIALATIAVVLAMGVAAAGWVTMKYHVISGKLYPRDAQVLDLREENIKPALYDKIHEKMPSCEIRWKIPFQNGFLENDVQEITVMSLSEQDVLRLDYARQLKTVHAEDCHDYEALEQLRQRRPELTVSYSIAFSGGSYAWDMDTLILDSVTEADIHLLKHLPNLKIAALKAGSYDRHMVDALRGTLYNSGRKFGVVIGGQILQDSETALEIKDIAEEELSLLEHFPSLKQLKLIDPDAAPEKLVKLRETLEGVAVSWQVSIGDLIFDETTETVDLSMVEITDLSEVERKLNCLPNLEVVYFGLCGIDEAQWGNSRSKLAASPIENEDLAAYRDRVRENYKVVWTVRLGPSIALRTDADNFMPNHFGVGQLPDNYAYNLRYCEDMISLDVGHMTLTDISFVEYMPKLKYFILAWTEVQYIEPIRSCKNLVFLELDNSCIRDISPLVDCTALEDLNLGNTFCSVEPILGMTWLKNVYMIHRGSGGLVGQALKDTRVVTSTDPDAATVGYGWRRLPNYYAMRDCLHAPYMN